jgi:hypothetical protein
LAVFATQKRQPKLEEGKEKVRFQRNFAFLNGASRKSALISIDMQLEEERQYKALFDEFTKAGIFYLIYITLFVTFWPV